MYSTELIRKFPEVPKRPILFVVYNNEMVHEALTLIAATRGPEYLSKVQVVPLNTKVDNVRDYDVYIDPMVYKYQHSWND
jgi:hypothetical protein